MHLYFILVCSGISRDTVTRNYWVNSEFLILLKVMLVLETWFLGEPEMWEEFLICLIISSFLGPVRTLLAYLLHCLLQGVGSLCKKLIRKKREEAVSTPPPNKVLVLFQYFFSV